MRTTRFVMLAPLRGRRRSRDRRSRPTPGRSIVVASVATARRSRRSSPDGDRRGCRSSPLAARHHHGCAGRRRRRSTSAPSASRPAAMPAIRSDSLCRSSPAPRIVVVPCARGGGQAQDGDLIDGRRDVARSEVDGVQRRRADDEVGHGLAAIAIHVDARVGALLDVRAHRAEEVDDRAAGRVDADVAEGQLGVGMDRPGDEPERGRRDVARHALDRSPAPPSLLPPPRRRPRPARCPLDRDATGPQHPLRVVARARPVPGPSSDPRPVAPPAGSPT